MGLVNHVQDVYIRFTRDNRSCIMFQWCLMMTELLMFIYMYNYNYYYHASFNSVNHNKYIEI